LESCEHPGPAHHKTGSAVHVHCTTELLPETVLLFLRFLLIFRVFYSYDKFSAYVSSSWTREKKIGDAKKVLNADNMFTKVFVLKKLILVLRDILKQGALYGKSR
jgi:hypothetical protein